MIWCTDCCRIGKLQCDLQDKNDGEPCSPCQQIINATPAGSPNSRRICTQANDGDWPDNFYRGNVERKLRNASVDGSLPNNAEGRNRWIFPPEQTHPPHPSQQQRPQAQPRPQYNQGPAPPGQQGFVRPTAPAMPPPPRAQPPAYNPYAANAYNPPPTYDAWGRPHYNLYGQLQLTPSDDDRRLKERLQWEEDRRRDDERRRVDEDRRRIDDMRMLGMRPFAFGQPMPSAFQSTPRQPSDFTEVNSTLADQTTELKSMQQVETPPAIIETLNDLVKKVTKIGEMIAGQKRGPPGDDNASSNRKSSVSRGRGTVRENFDASTWGRDSTSDAASQSRPNEKQRQLNVIPDVTDPRVDLSLAYRYRPDGQTAIDPASGLSTQQANLCVHAGVNPVTYGENLRGVSRQAAANHDALQRGDQPEDPEYIDDENEIVPVDQDMINFMADRYRSPSAH